MQLALKDWSEEDFQVSEMALSGFMKEYGEHLNSKTHEKLSGTINDIRKKRGRPPKEFTNFLRRSAPAEISWIKKTSKT